MSVCAVHECVWYLSVCCMCVVCVLCMSVCGVHECVCVVSELQKERTVRQQEQNHASAFASFALQQLQLPSEIRMHVFFPAE